MGLDMYLSKKIYLGKDWEGKRKSQEITIDDWTGKERTIEMKDAKEIVFDAGYWRKANAIHKWFVNNVQDGEDDCGEYEVSREQLQTLLDLVNRVLDGSKLVKGKIQNGSRSYTNDKGERITDEPIMEDGEYIENPEVAEELLPTDIDGYFFGSKDYDQYYIADLKETKKILTEALKCGEEYHFTYSSSW